MHHDPPRPRHYGPDQRWHDHERKEPPVLTQVAEGVLVHQSELLQNNAVVVQGRAGVLLVDPGITADEMACLANDLSASWASPSWRASRRIPTGTTCSGTPSSATRPATARPAARTFMRDLRSHAGLAGPRRRGAAAGDRRGGTAGPVRPHHRSARRADGDPLGRPSRPDHRAPGARPGPCGAADRGAPGPGRRRHALRRPGPDARRLPPTRSRTTWPGCGCSRAWRTTSTSSSPVTGPSAEPIRLRARIEQDRAYLHALRDGRAPDDPRIGRSAKPGWEWVSDLHDGQARRLAEARQEAGEA